MERFCSQCGTGRAQGAVSCASCGAPFASPRAEPTPPPELTLSGQAAPSAARKRALAVAAITVAAMSILFALWMSGLLSSSGGEQAAAAAEEARPSGYDLVTLMPAPGPSGRCGYADASGTMRIAPQFTSAEFFSARSGLALVSQGNGMGVIDRQGRFVVPPRYNLLMWTGPDLFRFMAEGGRWGLIDARGRSILTAQFNDIDPFDREGRAVVRLGDRSGMIDTSGRFLIPLGNYSIVRTWGVAGRVVYFSEGLAVAGAGGQSGYLDTSGRWAISPRFAAASPFDESGLAAVLVRGSAGAESRWGYTDRRGNLVIPPQFAAAGAFGAAGLAPVKVGDSWGYVDREGAIRIAPRFAEARQFIAVGEQWRAVVGVRGPDGRVLMGFIDRSGDLAIPARYQLVLSFDPNGRAVAFEPMRGAGLIDGSGRFVAEPAYDMLLFRPEISGYLAVIGTEGQPGAQYGVIDRDGRPLGRGFRPIGCGSLHQGWAG